MVSTQTQVVPVHVVVLTSRITQYSDAVGTTLLCGRTDPGPLSNQWMRKRLDKTRENHSGNLWTGLKTHDQGCTMAMEQSAALIQKIPLIYHSRPNPTCDSVTLSSSHSHCAFSIDRVGVVAVYLFLSRHANSAGFIDASQTPISSRTYILVMDG